MDKPLALYSLRRKITYKRFRLTVAEGTKRESIQQELEQLEADYKALANIMNREQLAEVNFIEDTINITTFERIGKHESI